MSTVHTEQTDLQPLQTCDQPKTHQQPSQSHTLNYRGTVDHSEQTKMTDATTITQTHEQPSKRHQEPSQSGIQNDSGTVDHSEETKMIDTNTSSIPD